MKKQGNKGLLKEGLSSRQGFHGESNASLGNDTLSGKKNYAPVQPRKKLKTDRGEFTCN